MLLSIRIFGVFIGLALMIPLSLTAAPSPGGVNEVIELMGELEENYEAEKWSETREAYGAIAREVNEILAQSELEDPIMKDALAGLGKYVNEQNKDQVEVQYIRFQKQFFQFISQFDYEVHPVLTMIQQYVVDESSEAYAAGDYKDVISEMREAGNLIDHAKPLLVEKGVPAQEVDEFKDTVINLIMAGKKQEYEKMGELLEQIRTAYASFMTRYREK